MSAPCGTCSSSGSIARSEACPQRAIRPASCREYTANLPIRPWRSGSGRAARRASRPGTGGRSYWQESSLRDAALGSGVAAYCQTVAPTSKPYLSQLIGKIASPEVFGRSLITWLMGKTKPTAVTVRRRYRVDQSACEDAIRRLLDYSKNKRDR